MPRGEKLIEVLALLVVRGVCRAATIAPKAAGGTWGDAVPLPFAVQGAA